MKQTEIFFNTINLEGQELFKAKEVTGEQDSRILAIFADFGCTWGGEAKMTPFTCHQRYEAKYGPICLTSVRRSITVLTKNGKLEKLNEQGPGGYGMKNHYWRLVK